MAKRLITSSAAIAFSSRMVTLWCSQRGDDAFPQDIFHVEQIILLLLRVRNRAWVLSARNGSQADSKFVGRNRDEFLFRIP